MDDKIWQLRFDTQKAGQYFLEQLAYTIGPVELKKLTEEKAVTIVDVRKEADYEVSHIPGAISAPKDNLENNLHKLDKNAITVVYSYNQQCHLAFEACLILADYGYPCVCLTGGFKVWREDFRFVST